MRRSANPASSRVMGAMQEERSDDNVQQPVSKPRLSVGKIFRTRTELTEEGRNIMEQIVEGLKDTDDDIRHWLLDHGVWHSCISILIVLNAIALGLEADYPEQKHVWDVLEHVFTACFLTEMVIKLRYLGLRYFRNRANWLDCFLVWAAVTDIWMLPLVLRSSDKAKGFLRTLSILRMLRLARVGRVLRLVSQFRQFSIMIDGVIGAMKTSFGICCVMLIILYAWSIFCVEMIGLYEPEVYPGYTDSDTQIDKSALMKSFNPAVYFGSISKSMLTLLNMSLLTEFPEVVRPIMLKQPVLLIVFLVYIFTMVFGVLNVLVGLIVDEVIKVASLTEKESRAAEKARNLKTFQDIQDLVWNIDTNNDGVVDARELDEHMKEQQIQSLLDALNMPHGYTAIELLRMLDEDGDGHLNREEFVQSFYRLLGSDEFQRSCMAQMGINEIKFLIRGFSELMTHQMAQFEDDLRELVREVHADLMDRHSDVMGLWSAEASKPSPRTSPRTSPVLCKPESSDQEGASPGDRLIPNSDQASRPATVAFAPDTEPRWEVIDTPQVVPQSDVSYSQSKRVTQLMAKQKSQPATARASQARARMREWTTKYKEEEPCLTGFFGKVQNSLLESIEGERRSSEEDGDVPSRLVSDGLGRFESSSLVASASRSCMNIGGGVSPVPPETTANSDKTSGIGVILVGHHQGKAEESCSHAPDCQTKTQGANTARSAGDVLQNNSLAL